MTTASAYYSTDDTTHEIPAFVDHADYSLSPIGGPIVPTASPTTIHHQHPHHQTTKTPATTTMSGGGQPTVPNIDTVYGHDNGVRINGLSVNETLGHVFDINSLSRGSSPGQKRQSDPGSLAPAATGIQNGQAGMGTTDGTFAQNGQFYPSKSPGSSLCH